MNFLKKGIKVAICILLIAGTAACKKTAGEGGNSSIRGNVFTENWNGTFTIKNSEYPSADVEVYIIYGDNVSYSERIRTNYNGEYEFKYLRRGKYKIYVYSKDKTLQSKSGIVAVIKDVEITKKKETVVVDQITIYD